MERQIKFRGKRIKDGKWIYGNLADYSMKVFNTIIEKKVIFGNIVSFATDNFGFVVDDCAVDPATVGQYTGVDDVDGNPIFEGDIVETFSIYCSYRQVGDYPPPNVEVEEWAVKRSVNKVEFSYGSFDINGFPIMFEDMMSDNDEVDKSFERREFEDMWEDNSYNIRDEYPYLTWDYFCKPHIIGNIHDNPELIDYKQ